MMPLGARSSLMVGACIILMTAKFASSPLAQKKYPPAFPREEAKQLFRDKSGTELAKEREGSVVTLWEVTREKGKSTGMHEHLLDRVSITLTEGAVKITKPEGTTSIEQERIGSVRYDSKGTIDAEEGLSLP